MEKLSDMITWHPEALNVLNDIVNGMRDKIIKEARGICLEKDKAMIDTDVVWEASERVKNRKDQNPYAGSLFPRGD